jgi:urease accessory protein
VHDALALRASDGDLAGRLGRFNVLATAVLVGPALTAFSTGLLAAAAEWPVTRRAGQLAAASALGDRGCLIRLAGVSVERVSRTLRELLGFVPALLGDDPWTRKW